MGEDDDREPALAPRLVHDPGDGEVAALVGDGMTRIGRRATKVLANAQIATAVLLGDGPGDRGIDSHRLRRASASQCGEDERRSREDYRPGRNPTRRQGKVAVSRHQTTISLRPAGRTCEAASHCNECDVCLARYPGTTSRPPLDRPNVPWSRHRREVLVTAAAVDVLSPRFLPRDVTEKFFALQVPSAAAPL